MFKTFYDEKQNKLSLKVEGQFDVERAQALYQHLQTLLPACHKGFKLLADFSLVTDIQKDILPVIKKVMDLFNQHGVAEVIRIIPDPDKDIGFNILSVFHYDKHVKVVTRRSLEHAD